MNRREFLNTTAALSAAALLPGALVSVLGENETRIQLGLVYSIDARWNNQFDDRDSLLNLEHGYIP